MVWIDQIGICDQVYVMPKDGSMLSVMILPSIELHVQEKEFRMKLADPEYFRPQKKCTLF